MLTSPSGYQIWVRGFNPQSSPEDPSDFEIIAIEITDGLDHSGGLNSSLPADIQFYADVRKRLSEFRIIDHYDEIF